MKIINFKNIEELIFQDPNILNVIPREYKDYILQWKLSKQNPSLKQLGRKAILDFLNSFPIESYHQTILENYLNEEIVIEKFNYNIVENIKIPLNDLEICDVLCKINDFEYFDTFRDKDHLYISFWR